MKTLFLASPILIGFLASSYMLASRLFGTPSIDSGELIAGSLSLAAYVAIAITFISLRGSSKQPLDTNPGDQPPPPGPKPPDDDPDPPDEKQPSLDNKPWLSVVGDIAGLFDELERDGRGLGGAAEELACHVNCRLQEILEDSEVEVILDEALFDRRRHQPDDATLDIEQGAEISETLSAGFAVGKRIFRKAVVRVGHRSTGE